MKYVGFVGDPQEESVIRQILNMGPCDVCLWSPPAVDGEDRPRDDDRPTVDLDRLAEASMIVVNTGIERCRAIARQLGDVLTGRHVIVHTIRGIEAGTLTTASKIFADETPTQRIGFLSGPMRLDDIRQERPAAAVCASRFPDVHDLVEESMMSPRFRVYHSRDIYGAELSAIYARLLALVSGLAHSLQLGASLQATVFTRGLAEMARFVGAFEANQKTAYGLSGAGNLYVDTLERDDIDVQMGIALADGDAETFIERFGPPAQELVDIVEAFSQAAEDRGVEAHLLEAVESLLTTATDPDEAIEYLMALPALDE